MSRIDELKRLAESAFAEFPVEAHPLFVELSLGRIPPAEVRRIALQIFHVVEHFPRFLAAVLANLDDVRHRMPLVENLYEEHGHMDPARVHVETYRAFLGALGVDRATIARSQPTIPVVAYNRAVFDLCLRQSVVESLPALGVIEETVARAAVIVGRWTAKQELREVEGGAAHFSDHETLDLRHATEIYELAAERLTETTRAEAERGIRLAVYYQRRLYTDLLGHGGDRLS